MELPSHLRAISVGVGLKTEDLQEINESLAELDQLIFAINAEVVGSLVQRTASWTPATLIGSGKLQELKILTEETHANLVVFDHHLTGAQVRNLTEELQITVIDRTQIIIEIFARRARSHEGKLQVQLAQLLDQYSRQVGAWHGSLSRQGGGIGTRGPGEKAIEIDRRVIRNNISKIKKELEETRAHRSLHRASRRKNNIPTFALIGYTNAGKSTLLKELTHSPEVLVADQVFATLDPLSRQVYLPNAPTCILTDTVGFIRKLPTELVEAFKATLEETAEADVILHVVDFSSFDWEKQMKTVEKLIEEFGWKSKPIIYVFNKCDQAPQERKFKVTQTPRVFVSATTHQGLEELKTEMIRILEGLRKPAELFFPHGTQHKIFELSRESQILKQEEGSQGTLCVALLTDTLRSKWSEFLT